MLWMTTKRQPESVQVPLNGTAENIPAAAAWAGSGCFFVGADGMAKQPSFQFYPGDWLNDAALRMVSVGARGAWMDMICLMHQGYPYGHLKVNHKVILVDNLARILGSTLTEAEGWLAELEAAGVFSRTDDGCIYSRRMVRDNDIRLKRAAGGISGGNPALLSTPKDNHKVGSKVNLPPNLQPTPSSSSSSSSSSSASPAEEIPPYPQSGNRRRRIKFAGYSPDFDRFWEAYPPIRKGSKAKAWEAWQSATQTADPESLIAAAVEFAASPIAKTEYCPGPSPWLNDRRWEDDRRSWLGAKRCAQAAVEQDPEYTPF